MKTRLAVTLVAALAVVCLIPRQTHGAPSAAEIGGVMSDITTLDDLIRDATPEDTAKVVLTVIGAIQKSGTTEEKKMRFIALVVSRAVALKPDDAPAMMAELATFLKNDRVLPVVVSAAIIASDRNSPAVFDAMAARFTGNQELLKILTDAANSPVVLLTPPVVKDIRTMIGEMGLAAVPLIPAQEPTTVPLVPPLVSGRYPGQ